MFHTQYIHDFSVAEHYGLRNTACLYFKDVASVAYWYYCETRDVCTLKMSPLYMWSSFDKKGGDGDILLSKR
jgi:hypothetical protein